MATEESTDAPARGRPVLLAVLSTSLFWVIAGGLTLVLWRKPEPVAFEIQPPPATSTPLPTGDGRALGCGCGWRCAAARRGSFDARRARAGCHCRSRGPGGQSRCRPTQSRAAPSGWRKGCGSPDPHDHTHPIAKRCPGACGCRRLNTSAPGRLPCQCQHRQLGGTRYVARHRPEDGPGYRGLSHSKRSLCIRRGTVGGQGHWGEHAGSNSGADYDRVRCLPEL